MWNARTPKSIGGGHLKPASSLSAQLHSTLGFLGAAALGRRADHLVVTDFHPFASAHNLLFALYVVANMLRIDCTR
jgi:hypothetical protein